MVRYLCATMAKQLMHVGNKIKKMESKFKYTNERNVQIVIALLKAHGIHRVIASPGTTNMTFVVSIENDPWFQVWSSVDERSAAYLACGMAAETGEPVVISCTGATASRNYMPGLTEAYYRKLPVLAITSSGGARMQESALSLMQMAKTSCAVSKLGDEGLLYINLLTEPTFGGVTASFGMLGDIIVAEQGARIGFAGRRVIEQTIRQKLPSDFQTAEYLLKYGQVDIVSSRKNLKDTLGNILEMHKGVK